MKTAIFFDSFIHGGGAEKLALELARLLNADIYTSGYNSGLYGDWAGKVEIKDIGNFFAGISPKLGFVESAFRFALFRPEKKYDLYIFSGFFSIFAAMRLKPNIWYCCQPNRTIYDLKEFQEKRSNTLGKLLIKFYAFFWKPFDQWAVKKHVGKIISISETVRKRVKKYYGRESGIIYPPIDTKKYFFERFGDFFFFSGRLIPEKRTGLLLEAFSEMPEKKIVVAGTGPLKGKVESFAGKFGNISFLGRVSEKKLKSLLANCLASVYLPVQEDFGMFPLEANASGKACIAAEEGGCTETVIDGKNGFLIKPNKRELVKAVNALSEEKAKKMKYSCLLQAKKFGKEKFVAAWKDEVALLCQEKK